MCLSPDTRALYAFWCSHCNPGPIYALQCTKTSLPSVSKARRSARACRQRCSNCSSGRVTSRIGRWCHSIPRASASRPSDATPKSLISWSSIRETNASAPQFRITSRSAARFRRHPRPSNDAPRFPGQNEMPMCLFPASRVAIRIGSVVLVRMRLFIAPCYMPDPTKAVAGNLIATKGHPFLLA